jgi:hypothetical protein
MTQHIPFLLLIAGLLCISVLYSWLKPNYFMLKQSKLNALRNEWNERAAATFLQAEQLTDTEAQARAKGKAEALTMCAAELGKANTED